MTRQDLRAALAALLLFGSFSVATAEDRICNEATGLCEPTPFPVQCNQDSYEVMDNGEKITIYVCETIY